MDSATLNVLHGSRISCGKNKQKHEGHHLVKHSTQKLCFFITDRAESVRGDMSMSREKLKSLILMNCCILMINSVHTNKIIVF